MNDDVPMNSWCVQVLWFYTDGNVLICKNYLLIALCRLGGWIPDFGQCRVDLWWCYSKLLNFNAPPWNTYTLCVEETCANACGRNKHAMVCCTVSDIWPFKHFFDVDLVCVMQFSLLELVDVVKLFDFIVWFSNECVSPNKIEDYLVSSKLSCFVM